MGRRDPLIRPEAGRGKDAARDAIRPASRGRDEAQRLSDPASASVVGGGGRCGARRDRIVVT
jgi:hypothetical protein